MNINESFDLAKEVVNVVKAETGSLDCPDSALPSNPTVTMAYIPYQLDRSAYTPEKALEAGTFFTSLDKPFTGRSNVDE